MMRTLSFGLKLSVFNLIIVALLGTLMRYKIAFSFPLADQKFMLESHAHFAFYGWITSCLYIFILKYMQDKNPTLSTKLFKKLIGLNFITAYGMLVSFLVGGYSWVSILFVVLGILISVVFCFGFFKSMKGVEGNSKLWFQSGLVFAVLSAVGAFSLSYMLMTKSVTTDAYLRSQYFYLHFQYNGFFIFSCIGLLIHTLTKKGIVIPKRLNGLIFWMMFVGCLLGYGLSVLWMKLPLWIYVLIIIATLMQTYGALRIYLWVKSNWKKIKKVQSLLERSLLIYAGAAFAIKITLQLGSTIPSISHFAFGFRNIVISYLHLILLMCVSAFLLHQIIVSSYFKISKTLSSALVLFMLAVFLNELMLGIMGVFSVSYTSIPYAHEILFGITLLMFVSALLIFLSLRKAKPEYLG